MTPSDARESILLGIGRAQAPGTCGELAQGMLRGDHVQVTCPIDLYSTASVELLEGTGKVCGPEDSPKARRGIELALAFFERADVDARLRLQSPLPRGKGMGSSTADVAAAVVATAEALSVHISPDDVARIALKVEPSDGLMLPGIALFDHRDGKVAQLLGPAPAMRVLVLDFGGTVPTVSFNAVDRTVALKRLEPRLTKALDLITEGLRIGDVDLIGRGATLSAQLHQRVLPKPQLSQVLEFAQDMSAAGVNVAHSGTVLGVLLSDDGTLADRAVQKAWQRLSGLRAIFSQRLVDGGVNSGERARPQETQR